MKVLLVVYDSDSYISFFPIALLYVASALRQKGHEVEVYSQDKFHYPDEHLKWYLDSNKFDVVGISMTAGYYQYRKLKALSNAINSSKQRPFYVIGGHGPAPEPEFFIKETGADVVVIGEGEETAVELLDAIKNKRSLGTVKGIAFKEGDRIIINERRPLIKDVDSIPMPAYDLFPIDYYRLKRGPNSTSKDFVLDMISGRGCTFKCTFCYRMDKGFRPRSSEDIVNEIMHLKEKYQITYIMFQDELLMSSVERTEDLANTFIKKCLGIKWACNGRLNYAEPKLLDLMKKSGCVFINYGIEAMDDEVLKKMKKALTTKQVIKGVENTLKASISPGLNILFGNIGDTKETLQKGVEFLLKYDDGAQLRTIRPVTPYPGCPLYYYAIEKGFLKDCEDFYENKHVNSDLLAVNFTNLTDEEFHKALYEANKILIENYFRKHYSQTVERARKLYCEQDANFRGFRHT